MISALTVQPSIHPDALPFSSLLFFPSLSHSFLDERQTLLQQTIDLTQTTFGISRDDIGAFVGPYIDNAILPGDPFMSLDQIGVGELIKTAIERARSVDPLMVFGICGEHGGDPRSVDFFHRAGLDYVSCSPFRIPIARVAAAQAELKNPRRDGEESVGTAPSA